MEQNGIKIAVVISNEKAITNAQSVLDLLATASYEAGTDRIAIGKETIGDAFVVLSSGLAGEVLQKIVNYHAKIAIYGDFSHYTSKPLKDFMYESNQGNDVFCVAAKEEAIERLAGRRA